jgi:hypothetical protein
MSVLSQIRWMQPWKVSSGVPQYLEARDRSQQLDLERQRTAAQLAAQTTTNQAAQLELDRTRRYAATQSALQGVPRLQAVAQAYQAAAQAAATAGGAGPPDPVAQGRAAALGQAYQQTWQGERQRLAGQLGTVAPDMVKNLPDVLAPDQLPHYVQGLRQNMELMSDPHKWSIAGNDAAESMAAEAGDKSLLDPTTAMQTDPEKFRKLHTKFLIEEPKARATAGAAKTTNIVNGSESAPATPATKTKVQGQWLDAQKTLGMLDDLTALSDQGDFSQFLGTWNNAKFWASEKADQASMLDALPPDVQDQYNKTAEFRSILGTYKTTEFHKYAGSNQTKNEIDGMIDSVLNKEMSPTQFKAAMASTRRAMTREQREAEQVMTEGLRLHPDLDPTEYQRTAEYKTKVKVVDQQLRAQDRQARADEVETELRQSLGRDPTDAEVMLQVAKEGY